MCGNHVASRHATPCRSGPGTAEEVSTLLGRWLPIVGAMPQLVATKQHEAAVRRLVTWYERVFQVADYCADPPIDGLDALVDELVHVSVPADDHAELAKGRWAVRVAEELALWRRCSRDDGAEPVPGGGPLAAASIWPSSRHGVISPAARRRHGERRGVIRVSTSGLIVATASSSGHCVVTAAYREAGLW
jgi:hypothetical protein